MAEAFTVETIELDLPAMSAAFGARLRETGVPVTVERGAQFAQAVKLSRPASRRRLYFTARAVFVSDPSQLRAFNLAFAEVFGGLAARGEQDLDELERIEPHEDEPRADAKPSRRAPEDQLVPVLASTDEVLRRKRFDALEADELAQLYRLMAKVRIATPVRRSRRARRDRHGERIDLRSTLRASMRTGGDPVRLARRRRRAVRRRIVMLCDISGSMEPYTRAYLQFLTCAAGAQLNTGSSGSEAFVFATRLTRLTRALRSRAPDRAIRRAAETAPDWSSGTRIGDALKTFNDRHGRRGMARGAVVVILSDGWERGDPAVVGREMARLARLAHRIIWVNPRAAAAGFAPRAGGMLAALPHCDALVSGENLAALDEVVAAIARSDGDRAAGASREWASVSPPQADEEDEPWASATPVAGSSVAMPSGWSPSRGNTTPGWGSR